MEWNFGANVILYHLSNREVIPGHDQQKNVEFTFKNATDKKFHSIGPEYFL